MLCVRGWREGTWCCGNVLGPGVERGTETELGSVDLFMRECGRGEVNWQRTNREAVVQACGG